MSERDISLNKQSRNIYNTLAWVLLSISLRQFMIAWRKWNQHRKEKESPRMRVQRFLKKLT